MKAIRVLYLGHYVRKMDWRMLFRFMRHTRATSNVSYLTQILMLIGSSLRHNISPLEFYQFGFLSLTEDQRKRWAGTGTMYEFQLKANPLEHRDILNDKRRFHEAYRQFFVHEVYSRGAVEAEPSLIDRLIKENEQLVFKDAEGQCGSSVVIKRTTEIDAATLPSWMRRKRLDLVESYVDQHPKLYELSPSAVNTVRVFTMVTRAGAYRILGCRLRISVDASVDNLAAGNLAAPIDEQSGRVCGPGVYADITRQPETVHPITNVPITGFQIPFWEETLELVHRASLLHPENRSIGWDLVITPLGPGLIEGNHDWCKLVWQLPVQRGLKYLLMDNGAYA